MIKTRGLFFLSLISLLSCSEQEPQITLTEVVVDSVMQATYRPSNQLIGRIEAFDDAEIKANVSGYLLERNFTEGQFVKKDSPLFLIDPSPYQAELAKAKAELAKAIAADKAAELNFNRGQELRPKGVISAAEMDKLTSESLQAHANVEAAQAQLVKAEVNLAYTRIKAPFSGHIGRSNYSLGDLVGPESGALTTLVNINPIKVIFQVSEATYLSYLEHKVQQGDKHSAAEDFSVSIELSNGHRYPQQGKIDYIANRVNPDTGTIEGRAILPNPDNILKPGQYAKVIFDSTAELNALFISQSAVQADQQGTYVLSIAGDNTVTRSNVVLGERVDNKVIVKQGLNAGDVIIIRGLQQVRPGQRVSSKHINSSKATNR
ncbi:efflux RND transporter periplasmic adaptor subunit [Dasania sp. GY-MA-18]|uniref:Efflux RND transporter periplasmic adaptor subunit n=1 Tax=Dasania phycosphaerae TaxID=2950436 RepID=A0A9J6RIQ0_9GAMM|nr:MULTISPECIES: efflux RND transporter periplasmic adaptor subunit [Dasania]MCR8921880.1 efflux RND transporter periplasmic adaptor subunit [Dasania sp. GY-MA-18]MCZ0864308.1 efflux RND transporter periplasmic adaptor subunit [Dasania phycosphaerae]MCZ0868036.1 efflux RND transporter periplasmic adaptor subunit [Dasania phycosphaerae]